MLRYMNPIATHQPVLFELIRWTKGAILELGAGEYSTSQIHELAPGRKILTVDDNQQWLDNYKNLENSKHRFTLYSEDLFDIHGLNWSLALVDLSTWEQRTWAINQLRFYADYMIIHDAENKNLGELFEFWCEYRVPEFDIPTTLLASNIYPLEDIHIEGATIINHG